MVVIFVLCFLASHIIYPHACFHMHVFVRIVTSSTWRLPRALLQYWACLAGL